MTTEEFFISKGALMRAVIGLRCRWALCVLAGVLLAAVGLAVFVDLRWAIVALMVVFIVAPGLLAFGYIWYALSPRCLVNTYPHSVTVDDAGLATEARIEVRDEEKVEYRYLSVRAVWGDVARVRVRLSQLVIELKGTPVGILIIPYESMPDADAFVKFVLARG